MTISGRSAAGTVTRAGFDQMVAEICLGKVGVVAAREVSRFAATAATGSSSSRCAASSIPIAAGVDGQSQ